MTSSEVYLFVGLSLLLAR